MANNRLKVCVEGINQTPTPTVTPEPKRVPNIMKAFSPKPRTDTPTKNPGLRKFLLNVFGLVGRMSIPTQVAAEMVTLELKRTFYSCIKDHLQNDIETLNYMDGILFNNLTPIFIFIINYAIKNRRFYTPEEFTDQFGDIRFVIDRLINTTVEIVDYDTGFDYDKLKEDIDEFFYVFFG